MANGLVHTSLAAQKGLKTPQLAERAILGTFPRSITLPVIGSNLDALDDLDGPMSAVQFRTRPEMRSRIGRHSLREISGSLPISSGQMRPAIPTLFEFAGALDEVWLASC